MSNKQLNLEIENVLSNHGVDSKIIDSILSQLQHVKSTPSKPLHHYDSITAARPKTACYNEYSFRHNFIFEMPSIVHEGKNWFHVQIFNRDGPNENYLYNNYLDWKYHQIKQRVKWYGVSGLPTVVDDDLVSLDGLGNPVTELRKEPFFGFALRPTGYITMIGWLRLPKHVLKSKFGVD